jgi:hypothetical protein
MWPRASAYIRYARHQSLTKETNPGGYHSMLVDKESLADQERNDKESMVKSFVKPENTTNFEI